MGGDFILAGEIYVYSMTNFTPSAFLFSAPPRATLPGIYFVELRAIFRDVCWAMLLCLSPVRDTNQFSTMMMSQQSIAGVVYGIL